MSPQEIDDFLKSRAVLGYPRRFTKKQALSLHLLCTYGTVKAASEATGIKERTIHWHIEQAKQRRNMKGHDVRIYIEWHKHFLGVQQ